MNLPDGPQTDTACSHETEFQGAIGRRRDQQRFNRKKIKPRISLQSLRRLAGQGGNTFNIISTQTFWWYPVWRTGLWKLKINIINLIAINFEKSKYIDDDGTSDCRRWNTSNTALGRDEYCTKDIRARITNAKAAFRSLGDSLYESEAWTLRIAVKNYLDSFEMWSWKRMDNIRWTVKNEEVMRLAG